MALGSWLCLGTWEHIHLLPRYGGALTPPEGTRLAPQTAYFRASDWFPEGFLSRITLVDIVRHLEPHLFLQGASAPTTWLLERVALALRDGRLTAYVLPRGIHVSRGPSEAEETPAKESEPSKEEKQWVGIELVDDSDPPQPVAFEKYRIELPDYSVREGMLDQNGRAEISGIDPGSCKVTFPNLLREDWWLSGLAG